MSAKEVKFGVDARDKMLRGVEILANAVKVTILQIRLVHCMSPRQPSIERDSQLCLGVIQVVAWPCITAATVMSTASELKCVW